MSNPVHEIYGNRIRVRGCGICVVDNAILLVNHSGLGPNDFWSPPGGGVNFGESITDSLVREFKEETGVEIQVQEFLFASEFIQAPLHAIEFFFLVEKTGGKLKTGADPEADTQIIKDVKFMPWQELKNQRQNLHGIFKKVDQPSEIMGLRGYFKL
jgi:8-oxo-dGTP diphosphatase